MKNSSFDFENACKLANIQIISNSDKLKIKSVFNPLSKFNIGILLILFFASAIGILALTEAKDLASMILGILLGFGTGVIAFLSILSQHTNYVTICGNELKIRNRLKLHKQRLTPNHKVRMKTYVDHVKLKSRPGSGSSFTVIEIFISDLSQEYQILEFQLDEENSTIANTLGSEILRVIKARIKNL